MSPPESGTTVSDNGQVIVFLPDELFERNREAIAEIQRLAERVACDWPHGFKINTSSYTIEFKRGGGEE